MIQLYKLTRPTKANKEEFYTILVLPKGISSKDAVGIPRAVGLFPIRYVALSSRPLLGGNRKYRQKLVPLLRGTSHIQIDVKLFIFLVLLFDSEGGVLYKSFVWWLKC